MSETEKRACPHCGSTKIWKQRLMPIVKKKLKKQRFYCADCGKTFY